MDYDFIASIALIVVVVVFILQRLISARLYSPEPLNYKNYGDMTLETLELYSGANPFRPILLSIQGRVYNVSDGSQFYGRGGSYAAMAGKECARALAKMRLEEEDFGDDLSDCTEAEIKNLRDWISKFDAKYPVVGKVIQIPLSQKLYSQIVPSKCITLVELRQYDGTDPSKPMYLAISGVIFDVSSASEFYGPDGIYPFAGRECARAFALVSIDVNDCVANLEGLCKGDLDTLKEWEFKFRAKYDIVGKVVDD